MEITLSLQSSFTRASELLLVLVAKTWRRTNQLFVNTLERNEEVQYRSVTDEKRLAFAKQTRCCRVAALLIKKRGNRKTQCWG